jgi:hypothetical protein
MGIAPNQYDHGWLGSEPDNPAMRYNIVNGRVEECRRVQVHHFRLSDVEDPDLWAAEPLHKWETSDEGQWVMINSAETPEWRRTVDYTFYGYRYVITAKFTGPKLTEWLLRYGDKKTKI